MKALVLNRALLPAGTAPSRLILPSGPYFLLKTPRNEWICHQLHQCLIVDRASEGVSRVVTFLWRVAGLKHQKHNLGSLFRAQYACEMLIECSGSMNASRPTAELGRGQLPPSRTD